MKKQGQQGGDSSNTNKGFGAPKVPVRSNNVDQTKRLQNLQTRNEEIKEAINKRDRESQNLFGFVAKQKDAELTRVNKATVASEEDVEKVEKIANDLFTRFTRKLPKVNVGSPIVKIREYVAHFCAAEEFEYGIELNRNKLPKKLADRIDAIKSELVANDTAEKQQEREKRRRARLKNMGATDPDRQSLFERFELARKVVTTANNIVRGGGEEEEEATQPPETVGFYLFFMTIMKQKYAKSTLVADIKQKGADLKHGLKSATSNLPSSGDVTKKAKEMTSQAYKTLNEMKQGAESLAKNVKSKVSGSKKPETTHAYKESKSPKSNPGSEFKSSPNASPSNKSKKKGGSSSSINRT